MSALTANRNINTMVDPEYTLREFPVGADEHIYKGGWVGVDPAGYAKAFESGDIMLGLAYEESDNTASGNSAGDTACRVIVAGTIQHALTSVALTDVGKAAFAVTDADVQLAGMPDAMVGRIVHYSSSNLCTIRLKRLGEMPMAGEGGGVFVESGFVNHKVPTGTTASTALEWDGFDAQSSNGLGVTHVVGANGGTTFEIDSAGEVATNALIVGASMLASAGIRFEARLHMSDKGSTSALDTDWGVSLGPTITDIEAGADRAVFRMNGNSADIECESDNATTDTGDVDSTIDNVETAGAFKDFILIVRAAGTVEFWINGARVLSGTTFAVRSSAILAAFVNMEKSGSDSTLGKLVIRRMRVSGAIA